MLLCLKEIQQLLGDVHRETAAELLANGEIRGFKMGNRWKVEPDEVHAYIQRKKDEAEAEAAGKPGTMAQLKRELLELRQVVAAMKMAK